VTEALTAAMRRAIAAAKEGAGFVSPNPLVGCVILDRSGELIATGYHARLGDLHAETHALARVADPTRLEGAHVLVTLEPCAHQGRQPSCARRLAELPIARVTYGLDDPDPRVSGRGVEILRAAGIAVDRAEGMDPELEELAEIFLVNQRARRPFVALKVAASLDGKVARPDGESQWITGPDARARVHRQRGEYDAVVTGAGTILRDDPRLDARDPRFEGRADRLVIMDPRGRVVPGFDQRSLVQVRAREDIFLVTGPGVTAPHTVTHVELPLSDDGLLDPRAVTDELMRRGLRSLYVEAGPKLASAFLNARAVDRLFLFVAPMLIGEGQSWTSALRIEDLAHALRLDGLRWDAVGPDFMATAKVQS
jgi:diaminohydroxyphosphoribosylaminopyrimidine deaminase/5-amino-6-(5-phosphoribosylamino)uracil reductase